MNKKKYHILLSIVIIGFVIGLMMDTVSADVGNSFSGGSGESSSSSSSDGDMMFIIHAIYLLSRTPLGMVVLVILAVLFILQSRNKKTTVHVGANPGIKTNQGLDEEGVLKRIHLVDPDFSQDNFKGYVSEVWLALQEAWEDKQWQKVRPFESDQLFNVHQQQLQEYIDQHHTNYLNKQNIRSIKLASFVEDENYDMIRVKLDASLIDYVEDDETKKVLEGSKTEYVYRSYNLEFIRKKGVQSTIKEGMTITNCPNCGAPTQVTSSGQCEYCKSVITNGDFGWVLNRYRAW